MLTCVLANWVQRSTIFKVEMWINNRLTICISAPSGDLLSGPALDLFLYLQIHFFYYSSYVSLVRCSDHRRTLLAPKKLIVKYFFIYKQLCLQPYPSLLKIKVLYWYRRFHEKPLMESFHSTKGSLHYENSYFKNWKVLWGTRIGSSMAGVSNTVPKGHSFNPTMHCNKECSTYVLSTVRENPIMHCERHSSIVFLRLNHTSMHSPNCWSNVGTA